MSAAMLSIRYQAMRTMGYCLLGFFYTNVMSQTSAPIKMPLSPPLIQAFAPTGKLRVGINLGNPVLASQEIGSSLPKGVSVDIANAIGKQAGVAIDFQLFKSAGATVEAMKNGSLDLIFVAIDPVRGADISYTPPYIQIEGAYLVKASSPLQKNDEVDRLGNEIVVGKGSAYDLFLTREIKQASLIRVASSPAVVEEFMNGKGNIAAGVKQQLEGDAKRYTNVRLLPGRFMVINQAIGTPRERTNSTEITTYLSAIITDLKSSGFVAEAMKRHQIEGARVAE
jgi:polar amino acid transport system substrate-binding protein